MKHIIYLLVIIITASVSCYSQGKKEGPKRRIAELEKIKLMEVLDMDEQTSIKFFSRHNEHKKNMDALSQEMDDIFIKIETGIDNEDPGLLKLSKDYISLEEKAASEKRIFIENLRDILSEQQIAKYVVFERKFRDEIRTLIMNHRMRRRGLNN